MEDKLNQLFALLCYYYGCQNGSPMGSTSRCIYQSRYLATKEAYCIMTDKTFEEVDEEIDATIIIE
jgi:hypothetical protein